jgi:hypothetical protein
MVGTGGVCAEDRNTKAPVALAARCRTPGTRMLCQETTQQIAQKEAPTFRWTRGSNPENSRLDEILRVRRGTSTSSTLEVTLADHVEVSTGIRRTVVGCCRIPYPNRTARAVLQGNPNRAMTHILIYREAELTRKCCEVKAKAVHNGRSLIWAKRFVQRSFPRAASLPGHNF